MQNVKLEKVQNNRHPREKQRQDVRLIYIYWPTIIFEVT